MPLAYPQPLPSSRDSPCILELMSVLPILLPCLVVQFMATLKCCQNTASLLTEVAVMCISSPSFRIKLNMTSSINSLLISCKRRISLSKIHSDVFLELTVWFQLWLDMGVPYLSNNIENSEAGGRIYSFFNSPNTISFFVFFISFGTSAEVFFHQLLAPQLAILFLLHIPFWYFML